MEKKITKRDRFNELLSIPAVGENPALVDFINHEVELLDRKNSKGTTKPSANQIVANELAERIVATLEKGKEYTIAEIIKAIEKEGENLSSQRVTPVMTNLVKSGVATNRKDKRKSLYSLV
jgi:hypothetical protein